MLTDRTAPDLVLENLDHLLGGGQHGQHGHGHLDQCQGEHHVHGHHLGLISEGCLLLQKLGSHVSPDFFGFPDVPPPFPALLLLLLLLLLLPLPYLSFLQQEAA